MTEDLFTDRQLGAFLLRDAREVISTPEKWTKRTLARNSDMEQVKANSKEAACFCALGALENVLLSVGMFTDHHLLHVAYNRAFRALVDQVMATVGHTSVNVYNDSPKRTHAEILSLFDEAIKRLEEPV